MTKKRKTIALSHQAYTRLKARRLPGETFSETIVRLATRRRPLSDFAGILSPEEAKRARKAIKENRQARRRVDEEISEAWRWVREGRTVPLDELRKEE